MFSCFDLIVRVTQSHDIGKKHLTTLSVISSLLLVNVCPHPLLPTATGHPLIWTQVLPNQSPPVQNPFVVKSLWERAQCGMVEGGGCGVF